MSLWKEFFEAAEENFLKRRYTVAAVNYAKAIFLMIDDYLKRKYNITITNHKERKLYLYSKRNIDANCRELLEIYEKIYEIYRDTYIRPLSREEALLLKRLAENVKEIVEKA